MRNFDPKLVEILYTTSLQSLGFIFIAEGSPDKTSFMLGDESGISIFTQHSALSSQLDKK
ncbi:hypothetical protein [Nostoc piscinale]|nr:hypothetical protein [Nostoc piscinale]